MLRARTIAILASGALIAATSSARAEDSCSAAYEAADLLVHHTTGASLVEARDTLRICAGPSCKEWMVRDCTTWLSEVEARMPSVVLAATDPSGRDLVDVTVSSDGTLLASSLSGNALEMNPGRHRFTFLLPDGRRAEQEIVLREGEKRRLLTVKFDTPASSAKAEAPTVASGGTIDSRTSPHSLRTAGLVTGGVGLAALGLGVIFGVKALANNGTADCDARDVCREPDARRDAQAAAQIADIAFLSGAILTAGGVVMVLLDRSSRSANTARIESSPILGPNPSGISLRARW